MLLKLPRRLALSRSTFARPLIPDLCQSLLHSELATTVARSADFGAQWLGASKASACRDGPDYCVRLTRVSIWLKSPNGWRCSSTPGIITAVCSQEITCCAVIRASSGEVNFGRALFSNELA